MASTPTGVHEISDRYVEDYAALDPITATYLGVPGHDEKLTDFSPEGHQARAELSRRAVAAVEAARPADADEETARAVFLERVGLNVEIHDAGLDESSLNVIASPVQDLRQVFDLMPTDSADDWSVIARRLTAMPEAIAQLRASLAHAADQGRVAAIRQVTRVAEQCETWAGLRGGRSFFANLISAAEGGDGIGPALRTDLETGAKAAAEAYADLARFLREDLAPKAPAKDAVGADVYRLWSRYFTGAKLDLAEAYEWGWEEFSRVETEMKQVAQRIKPGATLAEAAAALDADPRYKVHGQDAFAAWMQQLSDKALVDLRGVHFEIPDALMKLECRIAPPGGGVGAYYTGPTDDFSRPGRMWWSVPADKEEFTTWREVSTVYHEGAPGHHLQVATAVYQQARLNRFQRLMCWVSGYGEGWALYAERLMRELGYLDDDGNLLGMLDAHLFRAARVVVDIGMHLELEIPAGTGFHEGERWTPELGLEFMLTRTITDPAHVRDEIDRYLGWPGQAPSYKLGERLWLAAREEARQRHGDAFDLKRFHMQALEMGAMGLDTLREQLAKL
ncbi:Uncharacterized conserved protein, DUF885 familyt [Streptoalloteichus tenebrarius]|uniref:Uncharacterized conserved protein, DUF885 familyt n=1 Tax=Streptoalloteichus tenebrarius (strain ATCC 17920 / DSM 40477 / JCM 4838 / CBS 697.72 / NBRC 16177 / NCIMB 11028 / NRRL B-12390 / A12253. 1 / ISP 5477) TaxID=1933 RepID=A0ABT1HMJ9_STRSD|nr:DUF885 domain-containing protein [Streptoalloteichus tenebrarius]MCP2256742.1 Uncharacterized conserved protein, DUF885 familyt [Streptoalloteichus tenebrarius]